MAKSIHQNIMSVAIKEAQKAETRGEVPIGAVIYDTHGKIIAKDGNRVKELGDPTAHAEMLVIKKSAKVLETPYLNDYFLAVTLEPCAMCAQALAWARIGEIRFGAYDIKSGGTENGARIFNQATCHHKPRVYGGIDEEECQQLIQTFFKQKRFLDT